MTCIEMQPKCKRACDRCRFKRVRCLREGECCTRCIKDGKTCLFTDEEKKRGPKPKQNTSASSPSAAANNPTSTTASGGLKKRKRDAIKANGASSAMNRHHHSNSSQVTNQLLLSPISDSASSSLALHSDPILSNYYFPSAQAPSSSSSSSSLGSQGNHPGSWSDTVVPPPQAFFVGQASDVANYLQSFVRIVDPNHTLVNQHQLSLLSLGFTGAIPLTLDMAFLLRCIVAATILIGTNNPLDDLFLVHYDMAVKALPLTQNQELLTTGMTLLNFIDLTLSQNNYVPPNTYNNSTIMHTV